MEIIYHPIGIIHSPFQGLKGMPIQPASDFSAPGTVEIYQEFSAGLDDLDGFSHIILIYHLHQSQGYKLSVTPFLDTTNHGVFATRAPRRPNPIGLSVVRLNRIEINTLYVENLDILDNTPVLDIKPFIPEVDAPPSYRLGWLEGAKGRFDTTRADQRFTKKD
jgi:tRNA (adenine37-N6)-methyltransferase